MSGRRPYTEDEKQRGRALIEVLIKERNELGLTQEALATRSAIAVDTIRNLEKCKTYNPGFFTVSDIAEALGVALDDLLALHEAQRRKRLSRQRGVRKGTRRLPRAGAR